MEKNTSALKRLTRKTAITLHDLIDYHALSNHPAVFHNIEGHLTAYLIAAIAITDAEARKPHSEDLTLPAPPFKLAVHTPPDNH